jgi:RNA polymerase sigma factor (sigma-70 family)
MNPIARGLAPRGLHSLFHDGVSTGLTDKELLDRFASSRDSAGELAFAALVARHGPMVLSVCRRMLRDPHETEDAFQATFLILVRKGPAVRFEASLGPWLYGVTVKVARRVRTLATRRRWIALDDSIGGERLERRPACDADLRFAIDDFLAELPANYRAAIVLCYLEGLTHEEAAMRLACPVGTVRSRLARGRAILKGRLDRAGLAPAKSPASAAGPLEEIPAPSVVAASLADSIAQAAARFSRGEPLSRIVPTRIVKLVTGVTQTMTISKLAAAASLVVSAGLAAWGAAGLAAQTPERAASGAPRSTALATLSDFDRTPGEESGQAKDDEIKTEMEIPDDLPPVVLSVEPKVGAKDVDPGLKEIRVTFSKKMTDKSWSWPTGNKYAAPKDNGPIHFEPGRRTCVMPVKLEPGKTYVIAVNSERFRNFKDEKGHSAMPYLLVFRTADAAGR